MFSFDSKKKTRAAIPWYVMGIALPLTVIAVIGKPIYGRIIYTYFPVFFFIAPSAFLIGIGLITQFWRGSKERLLRVQKFALVTGLVVSVLCWVYLGILI